MVLSILTLTSDHSFCAQMSSVKVVDSRTVLGAAQRPSEFGKETLLHHHISRVDDDTYHMIDDGIYVYCILKDYDLLYIYIYFDKSLVRSLREIPLSSLLLLVLLRLAHWNFAACRDAFFNQALAALFGNLAAHGVQQLHQHCAQRLIEVSNLLARNALKLKGSTTSGLKQAAEQHRARRTYYSSTFHDYRILLPWFVRLFYCVSHFRGAWSPKTPQTRMVRLLLTSLLRWAPLENGSSAQ